MPKNAAASAASCLSNIPELSAEWLKRKISNLEINPSLPTLVVTDAGCLMHIAGGLHRQKKNQRVMHIAEVLNQR